MKLRESRFLVDWELRWLRWLPKKTQGRYKLRNNKPRQQQRQESFGAESGRGGFVSHVAGRKSHNDDSGIRGSRERVRQYQWRCHRDDGSVMGVVVGVEDATE